MPNGLVSWRSACVALGLVCSACAASEAPQIRFVRVSSDHEIATRLVHTTFGATVSKVTLEMFPTGEPGKAVNLLEFDEASFDVPFRWTGPSRLDVWLPCQPYDHARNHYELPDGDGYRSIVIRFHDPVGCAPPVNA